MSKTKFTTGPWRVSMPHQGRWPAVGIKANNGRDIADVWDGAMVGPEEVDANARLIAKSPEMYEALNKIRRVASGEDQVAQDDTEGMAWIDTFCRAVLAKAVRP